MYDRFEFLCLPGRDIPSFRGESVCSIFVCLDNGMAASIRDSC